MHDLQSKVRSLLDEKRKTLSANRYELADRGSNGRCASRGIVDQRHFTEHATGFQSFDDLLPFSDHNLTFDDREHPVAIVTGRKNRFSRLERANFRLPSK